MFMQTQKLKGSSLVKVVGIIMIIGGALNLIGSFSIFALTALAAVLGVGAGVIVVIGLVALVSGVVELIVGILGVKFNNTPDKVNLVFTLGIVAVVLTLVNVILMGVFSGALGASPFAGVLGFVLPVLYTIGAYQNKQAVAQTVQPTYQQPPQA
jgi:hypothetical protein